MAIALRDHRSRMPLRLCCFLVQRVTVVWAGEHVCGFTSEPAQSLGRAATELLYLGLPLCLAAWAVCCTATAGLAAVWSALVAFRVAWPPECPAPAAPDERAVNIH